MSSRRREDEPIPQSYTLSRPNEFTKIDLKPRRFHFYYILLFILGTVFPPIGIQFFSSLNVNTAYHHSATLSSRRGPLWYRQRLLAQPPLDCMWLHSRRVSTQRFLLLTRSPADSVADCSVQVTAITSIYR